MDVENDEYCLRWNNHKQTLISLLETLREKESWVDVTLAAEGKLIRVHRLILCACSQYFEDMLNSVSGHDKQTIIFLKDIPFAMVKALVDYMYKGEVNVSQENLSGFLETAETLKIRGLTDKNGENATKVDLSELKKSWSPIPESSKPAEPNRPPLIPVENRKTSSPQTPVVTAPHDHLVAAREPPNTSALAESSNAMQTDYMTEDHSEEEEMANGETHFNENIEHTESINESNSSSKGSVQHVETYNLDSDRNDCMCPLCGRIYKRRESLTRHRKFECGLEPKFKCLLCHMRFKRKDKLRDHEMRRHARDPLLLAHQMAEPNLTRARALQSLARRRTKN